MATIDTILDQLKKWVAENQVIDAHTWVNAAQRLNILVSEEHQKLHLLQQQVAKEKLSFITLGQTVASAKSQVESTDDYRVMLNQKAKIGQIEEMIRLAKVQARLKDSEYRNN